MKNFKLFKFVLLFILVLILILSVRESSLTEYLSLSEAQAKISEFGIWAPIVFIFIFILATVSFLPVVPLDFVAGALFGTFWGVFYVVIGATIGAVIAFWITRTLGKSFIQKQLAERFVKLDKYDKKIAEHGLGVMFFLRLVPLFPFNGLNFAMGLTKIKFRDFFIATLFGIIPGAFAYVYFGDSLARVDLINIIGAVSLLILLALIYPVYNKFIKKDK